MHGYLMIEMNKRASAKTGDVEKLRQNLKKLTKNISRISCRYKDLSAFENAISLLAFFYAWTYTKITRRSQSVNAV